MGDKAKPLVSHMAGGFAVCELSLFVLAVTSRKIDPISGRCASDIQRPVVNVPHTAKRRKLRPRPASVSGPSFLPSALRLNSMRFNRMKLLQCSEQIILRVAPSALGGKIV